MGILSGTPTKFGTIRDIEKVQKRATKMVRGCKNLNYSERLRYLALPTLRYRRLRGDMIEVYKILHGYYDSNVVPTLLRNHDTRSRGNSLKLLHVRCNLDVKKYSFCLRVVGYWNSLPDNVVTACSLNSFK